MKPVRKSIIKFLRYLRPIWEGSDNKPSGKRILGIFLIISGVRIAYYGVTNCLDKIDSIIGLVATLLGGGLAFWGITAYFEKGASQPPTPPTNGEDPSESFYD